MLVFGGAFASRPSWAYFPDQDILSLSRPLRLAPLSLTPINFTDRIRWTCAVPGLSRTLTVGTGSC